MSKIKVGDLVYLNNMPEFKGYVTRIGKKFRVEYINEESLIFESKTIPLKLYQIQQWYTLITPEEKAQLL